MFNVSYISKENELNKILKQQKSSQETINILFVSPWDNTSKILLEKIENELSGLDKGNGEKLFIVNSYDTPHSFVIFNTSQVPQLVMLNPSKKTRREYLPVEINGRIEWDAELPMIIEDYVPKIYEKLNIV